MIYLKQLPIVRVSTLKQLPIVGVSTFFLCKSRNNIFSLHGFCVFLGTIIMSLCTYLLTLKILHNVLFQSARKSFTLPTVQAETLAFSTLTAGVTQTTASFSVKPLTQYVSAANDSRSIKVVN